MPTVTVAVGAEFGTAPAPAAFAVAAAARLAPSPESPLPPPNSRREAAAATHSSGEFTNGLLGTPPSNDDSATAPEATPLACVTTGAAGRTSAAGTVAAVTDVATATGAAVTARGASSFSSWRAGRDVTEDFGAPDVSRVSRLLAEDEGDLRLRDEPEPPVGFTSCSDEAPGETPSSSPSACVPGSAPEPPAGFGVPVEVDGDGVPDGEPLPPEVSPAEVAPPDSALLPLPSSAQAIPAPSDTAAPTPSATAKPPTRPTNRPAPTEPPDIDVN
ncbi:hypothetical protein H7J86_10425 [Mycobacterium hackensackense]|uniref:hypothetical protein n=1 Tax=Mycobacterium hackensackense TaxID=228909 RepID=UPI002265A11A|nr:hypothetical protein [Mycobacterium hackensackense]MCV7252577.1 hypothetical protein [Mycobacterium hackensackense]